MLCDRCAGVKYPKSILFGVGGPVLNGGGIEAAAYGRSVWIMLGPKP